jgi:hypothetical protein
VDPHRPFLQSGFDSLSVIELRNRLNRATGLRLGSTALFDSKTPADLAELIYRGMIEHLDAERAPAAYRAADLIHSLVREAVEAGKAEESLSLMRAVADLRPSFTSLEELGSVPGPETLAAGPSGVRLIALSSPMADGGPHQHARLAAHFEGRMPVTALALPGFEAGGKLPASGEAAVAAVADGVRQVSGGGPFVLLGYSSGGVLAYAVARHLETMGHVRPAAVILLDTFRIGDPTVPIGQVLRRMFSVDEAFGSITADRLSAMGRWLSLLSGLRVGPVTAPVLFVQAAVPYARNEGPSAWLATPFEPSHALRSVPADHFSMVGADSDVTSRVVLEWLDEVFPSSPEGTVVS